MVVGILISTGLGLCLVGGEAAFIEGDDVVADDFAK